MNMHHFHEAYQRGQNLEILREKLRVGYCKTSDSSKLNLGFNPPVTPPQLASTEPKFGEEEEDEDEDEELIERRFMIHNAVPFIEGVIPLLSINIGHTEGLITSCNDDNHGAYSSHNTTQEPTSSAERANTELSLGWRQYCSSPALIIPRVSGLRRQIMIINGQKSIESASISPDEVCLELNIGPADHAKKTLHDIHSEERSGFIKWQRPELKRTAETAQGFSSAGRACWSAQNLKVRKDSKSESSRSLTTQSTITSAAGGKKLEMRLSDEINYDHTELRGSATDAVTSPLGLYLGSTVATTESTVGCLNYNHNMRLDLSKDHNEPASACSDVGFLSTASVSSRTSSVLPHWLAHNSAYIHEPLPTSMLLKGAFPSEMAKILKLDVLNLKPTLEVLSADDMNEMKESSHHKIAHNRQVQHKTEMDVPEVHGLTIMPAHHHDETRLGSLAIMDLEHSRYQGLSTHVLRPIDAPNVQEKSLIEFLCAKKQHKDHFLDKVVVKADVYHCHPWHFTGEADANSKGGTLYFCCTTKYTKRGNMTRNRMTREGGRWKQQGMVQPILTARGYEPAHKTYLSYIPRGKANSKAYFIPSTPGRVKHRHRMIEISLEEDLKSEKSSLKLKVTPKPFLVVCVLRKTT